MGKVADFGKRPTRRRRGGSPRGGGSAPVWLPIALLATFCGVLYLGTADFNLNAFARVAETIQGRASVIDGDTIEVVGQRVRLNGIDAPESSQQCEDAQGVRYQCGAAAAEALGEFLAKSRPVRCEFVEWDQYRRYVGNCFRADGESVAAWLVESGYALDWPKYSGGAYAGEQASARHAKRALWSGPFQEPWEWRSSQKAERKSANIPLFATSSGECNIKGNISN